MSNSHRVVLYVLIFRIVQEEQKAQENLGDWFATPVVPINGRLSEIVRRTSAGPSDVTASVQEKGAATITTAISSGAEGDARTAYSQHKGETSATKPAIQPPGFGRELIAVTTLKPNATAQQPATSIPSAAQEPQLPPLSNKQKKKMMKKAKKQMTEHMAAAAKGSDLHSVTVPLADPSGVVNLPQLPAPALNVTKAQVVRLSVRVYLVLVDTG